MAFMIVRPRINTLRARRFADANLNQTLRAPCTDELRFVTSLLTNDDGSLTGASHLRLCNSFAQ